MKKSYPKSKNKLNLWITKNKSERIIEKPKTLKELTELLKTLKNDIIEKTIEEYEKEQLVVK